MAISLASLRRVRADQPPRLLIYGPEKMGKTSLAAQFPKPVFLQTERGESAGMEFDALAPEGQSHLQSYGDVIDALTALAGGVHDFQTVVVDSTSALEKLIWAETCSRNGWANLEAPGYGKGYAATDALWEEVLDGLNYLRNERGMAVVLVGHSAIEKFDDPETQSYSIYSIDLHKRAAALLKREVDAILLVKKEVTIKTEGGSTKNPGRARADGGDQRWIYTEGRPQFTAGNRYGMPARLLYPAGEGYAALAPYFPGAAAPQQKAA